MIVLDTNVISQFIGPNGSKAVLDWLDRQAISTCCITAVSAMEIRFGIEMLADGRKKTRYAEEWSKVCDSFAGRILPFDGIAADIAGRLSAQRTRRGVNIDTNDTQIAAIAVAHNATIATRNGKHFPDLPVGIIDPWSM
jgi:toxin FitB